MKSNSASNKTLKANLNTKSQKKSKKIVRPKCSKLEDAYADTKNKILHELGQGTYGLTFRGCYNTVCSIKQGIKLSSVSTRYPDDKFHPTNLEINMGKELSTFVQKGYTPNINMIMESTRCNLDELKKLKSIKGSTWLKENLELRSQGNIHPFINIYFMEIGTMDLKKFIKMRCEQKTINFPEMLEIMFQIFHTLSVIQYKIPEYRHNDLKPNNLLVKISGDNLKRNFNQFSLVDGFQNGSKKFFIPHRGYTVKMIDFDFNNAKKYPNRKLRGFKNTNFRYLGYSPAVNPVFDVHFILNFFYASRDIMESIPEFKEFIKKVLPSDCIGSQNKYVEQHKLTAYYVNKETNYIPKDLLTPTELIHFTKYFDRFLQQSTDTSVRKEFATPFKAVSNKLRQRRDMFNVFLRESKPNN